jgi:hypothetical protein
MNDRPESWKVVIEGPTGAALAALRWSLVQPRANDKLFACRGVNQGVSKEVVMGSIYKRVESDRARAWLGLILLLPGSPQGGHLDEHSARLGELQITVTAVGTVSREYLGAGVQPPHPGHHFVMVKVKTRNIGTYSSCVEFNALIKVDAGYEYQGEVSSKLRPPKAYALLPTESSEGSYLFQVKDGTKPVKLKLVWETLGEFVCSMSDGRSLRHVSEIPAYLSLRGLPTPL